MNAWAQANAETSKRENNYLEELQKELARKTAKKCAAKLMSTKAVRIDEIADEFVKNGGEGVIMILCRTIGSAKTSTRS